MCSPTIFSWPTFLSIFQILHISSFAIWRVSLSVMVRLFHFSLLEITSSKHGNNPSSCKDKVAYIWPFLDPTMAGAFVHLATLYFFIFLHYTKLFRMCMSFYFHFRNSSKQGKAYPNIFHYISIWITQMSKKTAHLYINQFYFIISSCNLPIIITKVKPK